MSENETISLQKSNISNEIFYHIFQSCWKYHVSLANRMSASPPTTNGYCVCMYMDVSLSGTVNRTITTCINMVELWKSRKISKFTSIIKNNHNPFNGAATMENEIDCKCGHFNQFTLLPKLPIEPFIFGLSFVLILFLSCFLYVCACVVFSLFVTSISLSHSPEEFLWKLQRISSGWWFWCVYNLCEQNFSIDRNLIEYFISYFVCVWCMWCYSIDKNGDERIVFEFYLRWTEQKFFFPFYRLFFLCF